MQPSARSWRIKLVIKRSRTAFTADTPPTSAVLRELFEKHQRLINRPHKMMTPIQKLMPGRRTLSAALFLLAFCAIALVFVPVSSLRALDAKQDGARVLNAPNETARLDAFRQAVGGSITPLIIELKEEPGVLRKVAAEKAGQAMTTEQTISYAQELLGKQNTLLGSLGQRGVRVLLRETDVKQLNGAVRHIQYRFTYLLNGFVAYVATEDIARLRSLPEVAHVSEPEKMSYQLDRAIDYSLGIQTDPADRRTAVYGATKEFRPIDTGANPETPRAKIDGFEGQGMNIAIIDSGVDYRHPMFGGTGLNTPLPRVSGEPEAADDNKKVIYFYAFSEPVGDPTDDFGHGTLVASCAAGFAVDGNTPARTGFGTGRNGTGIGPTTNGSQLIGTAPQARIMAYKVCGPAPQCAGDIELSIEDAASPVTLTGTGDGGSIPTMVSKPVADVINLSLGDEVGDPAGPASRAANNAALAGTIVVASAGNSGPGPGTIGSPSAATLALSVAASLDPGSVAGSDVLAADQIPLETCDDNPRPANCDNGTQVAGPPEEAGASSNANLPQPGAPQGIRIFPVAGGGGLPVEENPGNPTTNTGSLSAHYAFVDFRTNAAVTANVRPSVTNRIALVIRDEADPARPPFGAISNAVAPLNPAAIVIITPVESATAVVVVGGIPTFTVGAAEGADLLDRLIDGESNGSPSPVNGAVSRLPIRLADTISLEAFQGVMAGFSSRGPNDQPNARFRTIKPDVTGPGVGIFGAATPEGLPDETVGLASTTGYTTANGTSFSGPVTAGAIALVRQRVREELNLDTTNLSDPQYRAKRFDTVTVARALLQNSATNLRSGLGVPQGDGPSSVASINDMGSGHINIAAALTANAIMVAPTALLTEPREYTTATPPASPQQVLIPTVSFGEVPVVDVNGIVSRTREVIIRDVKGGAGGGSYNLTVQDNRLPLSGFTISFTSDAAGTTPITSVTVPAGGQASFFVRAAADGTQITIDPTEIMWYVTATAAGSGQTMRMPFYFRAVSATVPNIAAPIQLAPTGTEGTAGSCAGDTNGAFAVRYNYSAPGTGGPAPVGFRVQEGTRSDTVFFDNADEPLVGGANEKFTGSPQWTSQVNPQTGSLSYFIPDAAEQNESLTMVNAVVLPPGGASLSFVTTQDTEEGFDFANVDVSADGVNFTTVASFSGTFVGTRLIDISGYAGQTIKVRFRLTSDLTASAPGWFVEDIRISSDDFRTVADTAAATTSVDLNGRTNGTYTYRVAGLFTNPDPMQPGTTVTGPYSNLTCVTVNGPLQVTGAVSRKLHAGVPYDVELPLVSSIGIEPRRTGSGGSHQVVFRFPNAVNTTAATATAVSETGGTATVSGPPVASGDGREVAVNLSGVSDAQRLRVTLLGVSDGTNTGDVGVSVGMLLGDTNADGSANSGDAQETRTRSGQLVSGDNFRSDVNTDGTVNSGDAFIVRGRSGNAIP